MAGKKKKAEEVIEEVVEASQPEEVGRIEDAPPVVALSGKAQSIAKIKARFDRARLRVGRDRSGKRFTK